MDIENNMFNILAYRRVFSEVMSYFACTVWDPLSARASAEKLGSKTFSKSYLNSTFPKRVRWVHNILYGIYDVYSIQTRNRTVHQRLEKGLQRTNQIRYQCNTISTLKFLRNYDEQR